MKDRLNEIIEKKGLSATKFASLINVNPSAVSHLLKGRNNPGYDVLVNIAKAFPDISMDWLLTGKGRIYNQEPDTEKKTASTIIFDDKKENVLKKEEETPLFEKKESLPSAISEILPPVSSEKTLKRIVLFFNDGSFEDYIKS